MVGGEGRLMCANERLSCAEPLILPVLLDCPWQKIRLGELQINQAVGCHLADYFCSDMAPEELYLPLPPEESKQWPPMASPTSISNQHLSLQCLSFLVPYSLWRMQRVLVVWSVEGWGLGAVLPVLFPLLVTNGTKAALLPCSLPIRKTKRPRTARFSFQ